MKNIKNMQLDDLVLSFKEIWSFDKRLIFILIADVFIDSLSPFPDIILAGKIVDSISSGSTFQLVIFYVMLLFGLNYLLTAIGTYLDKSRDYLFIMLTNKMDNDINHKCLNIDYEQFNEPSIQDRVMLINDLIRGNNFFTSLTLTFSTISRFVSLVGIVCVMTTLNIWLLLIAVVVIVLQALLYYVSLKHNKKYNEDSVSERRKNSYLSQLAKSINSKKDVIMYSMSGYILEKIKSFQNEMLAFDRRRIRESGFMEMATYSLSVGFQISAYLLLGINAFRGDISIGGFTTGITSLINFMSASAFVTTNIIALNDNFTCIRQYKSFHKIRSKYDLSKDKIIAQDIDFTNIEIEFRNVSFRYPNSTSFVLRDINLKIKNGEKLAVVGFNGAGKTTFTLLLARMYDPTEGDIYLNGINIRDIDYSDYQKIFSTVNQDFSLLAFSLLENVAITDSVTEEEKEAITELLKSNGLTDRLNKLYRGINTPVTKTLSASGVDLSGGESQKVAIVRALYKNAPVLILDEPTAALDPVAEYETYKRFSEMSNGKTTVLISHRIYSTRFCDKIAVFEKGRIVEYGTFDELIGQKGRYYEFFNKQAKYFEPKQSLNIDAGIQ